MSKFKGILDAAKGREPESEKSSQETETQKLQSRSVDQSQIEPPPKRGRPKAKRSDPDYEQVTAYIRKNTHTTVKIELLKSAQDGQKREFSELVQDLLEQWLKLRT
ncbi:hypothetical protein [aff. Roholtiella sp. LEGE 12411]|uniref:hypothetical protein n=1 Tax=aff. Roholtiella sp. LEGE 12411 TaxID=1828822 RepID=UPI00187EE0E3|nr:hypothetical protein [aff. Roholtiella sp. LEGE 12411]